MTADSFCAPPDDRAPETRYGGLTIEELRALHEAAAPSPWTWVKAYEYRGVHWCLENEASARVGSTLNYHLVTLSAEEYEYDDDGNATRLDQTPDFAVIAAARNALPDLLSAVGALGAALDAAHNDKIESVAIVKAEAAVNWSIASYALEQWEEWVDSELDGTANYADTKAEIANLRASLGSGSALGREGGEEKG